jgi:ankyrin repeat protein
LKVSLLIIFNCKNQIFVQASWKGYADIVRDLLEYKADVDLQNSDGNTAIMMG